MMVFLLPVLFCLPADALTAACEGDDWQSVLEMRDWELFFTVNSENVIERCTKALADPKGLQKDQIAVLRDWRARAYSCCGKLEEAERDFDSLRTVSPENKRGMLGKAATLLLSQKNTAALDDLKEL